MSPIFQVLFSAQDPRLPTPSQKAHPKFKVDPFLKWFQEVYIFAWLLGVNISLNMQTMGFQV